MVTPPRSRDQALGPPDRTADDHEHKVSENGSENGVSRRSDDIEDVILKYGHRSAQSQYVMQLPLSLRGEYWTTALPTDGTERFSRLRYLGSNTRPDSVKAILRRRKTGCLEPFGPRGRKGSRQAELVPVAAQDGPARACPTLVREFDKDLE